MSTEISIRKVCPKIIRTPIREKRILGTFSAVRRLTYINIQNKGEQSMDDLSFNPSALLIVGMLIGVVCTLLGI